MKKVLPLFALSSAHCRRFGLTFFLSVVLGASYYLFVCTALGQAVDTLAMFAFHDLNKSFTNWDYYVLQEVYWFLSVPFFILAVIVCFLRKRPALTVRIGLMVLVSSLATQLLKHYILVRPDLGISFYMENSFPSGHTTIAMAGAAALVAASSVPWRRLATYVSAIYVSIIGVAVMTARWHRLSDVLAAFIVVAIFSLIFIPLEENRQKLKVTCVDFLPLGITLVGVGAVAVVFYYLYQKTGFIYTTANLEYFVQSRGVPVLVLVWGSLLVLCGSAWLSLAKIGKTHQRKN